MPPVVPALVHDRVAVFPDPANHEHVAYRGRALERLVDKLLEWHDLAATITAVGGYNRDGLGVVDAIPKRLGREAAEHHGVDRTDTGTRQQGDGSLGDHGEIDGHPVAFAHP